MTKFKIFVSELNKMIDVLLYIILLIGQSVLILFPLTKLVVVLANIPIPYIPALNTELTFTVFMYCLFCFCLFLLFRETKYKTGGIYGYIVLFSLFNITTFNWIKIIVTIIFCFTLFGYLRKILKR